MHKSQGYTRRTRRHYGASHTSMRIIGESDAIQERGTGTTMTEDKKTGTRLHKVRGDPKEEEREEDGEKERI